MRMVSEPVHSVYRGDNLHTHVALLYLRILASARNVHAKSWTKGHLVPPTAAATTRAASPRESPSTAATGSTTTGFLACFIDNERSTIDFQSVKFFDGPGRVVPRAKFDKAEST
jgi:hypothetical protein